jgi:hypothetical protein
LRKRRQALKMDMDTLVTSADDFAEEAKKMHMCITKSNVLRQGIRLRKKPRQKASQPLDRKLLQ